MFICNDCVYVLCCIAYNSGGAKLWQIECHTPIFFQPNPVKNFDFIANEIDMLPQISMALLNLHFQGMIVEC